jgi:acylphosphatase
VATKIVRVLITGRVQGVWYRGWTVQEAQRVDLNGWVRNHSDGSVEALFSGLEETVDAMIEACRQGPPSAQVTDVVVEPFEGPLTPGFRQLPTV